MRVHLVLTLKPTEWRFLAHFGILFFLPYGLLQVLDLSFLTAWIAGVQTHMLNFLGVPAAHSGPLLFAGAPSAVYQIVADCTGLVMVILLFALLFATTIPSRRRISYLLVFAPLLLAFNLARLAAVFLTGAWFGLLALELAHVVLWFVDSGVVLAVWAHAADVQLFNLRQAPL